mmetsp:Transcript_26991/g.45192  ORF Transcript_26991/g.45192 Transcript_26991/m.45192 type:complete len:271 (+) Transcript_26991:121-933(+)
MISAAKAVKFAFRCSVFVCTGNILVRCASSSSNIMQTLRTDGLGGRGITFVPRSGEYTNLLVWMHGLGDTADGWASLMPQLQLVAAANTKIVLPTAPDRPISLNGGYEMPGWSDIYGLGEKDPEDRKGFDESAERVNAIVQQEIDQHGVSPSRVVLAGFSQGGAVALHTALRSPHKLGGVIALSSWLPLRADYPAQLSSTAASSLPVLQVHGDADMVVSYEWGKQSNAMLKNLLQAAPTPPAFHTIQGMGHSSDPEEIALVKSFLNSIFK